MISRAPYWLDSMTVAEFEDLIESLPTPVFERLPRRSKANREWRDLPMFRDVFDQLCNMLGTLPTQDFYAGYYFAMVVEQAKIWDKTGNEIILRAKRNYPSFIREYHLYLMLKESFPYCDVIYTYELDDQGLDFMILHEGKPYGIRSYMNDEQLRRKVRYVHGDKQWHFPVLNITVDGGKVVNNIWLYSDYHMELVEQMLREGY